MGISPYLKEIGRGSAGARHLTREQAADLMGQLLDGQCTDLELGAFCIAMRVKGETPADPLQYLRPIVITKAGGDAELSVTAGRERLKAAR